MEDGFVGAGATLLKRQHPIAHGAVHCVKRATQPAMQWQGTAAQEERRKILTLSWLCRFFFCFCDIFAEGFCIRATFCGFCGCWHAAQRKRDVPWAGGPCQLVALKFLRERLFCLCARKKCENCKLLRVLISVVLRVSQLQPQLLRAARQDLAAAGPAMCVYASQSGNGMGNEAADAELRGCVAADAEQS